MNGEGVGATADWDMLYRTYNRQVRLVLFIRRVDYDDVDDLSQDVWVHLQRNFRSGKLSYLSFPGIAVAQAKHLASDYYKRKGRSPIHEPDLIDDDYPDLCSDEAAHFYAAISAATAQLSIEERRVSSLLFGESRTTRQAAAQLKISRGIVSSVRRRFRELVRRYL